MLLNVPAGPKNRVIPPDLAKRIERLRSYLDVIERELGSGDWRNVQSHLAEVQEQARRMAKVVHDRLNTP